MVEAHVKASLCGEKGEHIFEKILVTTDSILTIIPKDVCNKVGVYMTPLKIDVKLKDGTVKEAKVGIALLIIKDKCAPVQVASLEDAEPVVGAHALELLGLRINPATGEVEERQT